ncbi:OFA family MFS transporter [Streptomyces boncukensis]|uniref:OFA family MFS transporter n=1 Tax=Streptomyces boncukensis TaxID=2711219 RepID=A0A6G4WT21_9ACTN|nr:OFA family MFS transporter [Streptomyces boncukensis]NGO67694.1 OFA family MFS transporter [Streptomyces boncukensis]
MTTTDLPSACPYREVQDRNGRIYRIGETDRDVMGRPRWTMVLFPWIGMMAISSSEYAFTSAEDTLHDAHAWSSGNIFWLMGVWVFFQAAVAFPAGQLRESGRLPARNAMMLGALGTLLGYFSLAYAPHVIVAYFGYGMFSGIGAGLVYATCVNMVGKWYPERKGGKTGLVNGGFAYGAVPFVFLFTSYLDLHNYQGVFVFVGALCCAGLAVSGWFFRDPPKNWWPADVDPLKRTDDPRILRALEKNPPAVKQYTPREAARTPVLWMMWFCLLCTAGINIFGIAMQVPFGKDMGFAGGIVATAMSLKAIVNGTGRGVIGWISDRYGRRNTLIFVCVVLGLAQYGVLASGKLGVMPLFLVCSMVSGFGGGAIFPLFAAMTADYFGENHNATNYGMVYSSKLISGLVGSGVGAIAVDLWDYEGAFVIAGSVGLGSAVLATFLRSPGRPSPRKIRPNPMPISREAM